MFFHFTGHFGASFANPSEVQIAGECECLWCGSHCLLCGFCPLEGSWVLFGFLGLFLLGGTILFAFPGPRWWECQCGWSGLQTWHCDKTVLGIQEVSVHLQNTVVKSHFNFNSNFQICLLNIVISPRRNHLVFFSTFILNYIERWNLEDTPSSPSGFCVAFC